nr:hypothetical protein [uncultured Carboxylicivirga sp.]
MMWKEILLLLLGLITATVMLAQDIASNKITKYNKIGKLKIDTSFQDTYLKDFMIPFSEFNDLQNCRIKIKNKKLKTTMAARPNFFSLLLGKKNRRYVVVVNNDENFNGVKLKDVPSEARIGLFAHELMHIRDYESRKITGVIERGYQYLSFNGKIKVEHYTDSLTISAGFGQNLYHWANFVLHDSNACEEYKAFKAQVYMKPVSILSQMEQTF